MTGGTPAEPRGASVDRNPNFFLNFFQVWCFFEQGLTKLQIQRLFTPAGMPWKDVWVGNEWPGADKGPAYGEEYCGKEDEGENVKWDPIHTGEPSTDEEYKAWHAAKPVKAQGKRTDLLLVKDLLDEGASLGEIIQSEAGFTSGAKHLQFFLNYESMKKRRTEFSKPNVEVFYGGTGTGKTRKAYEVTGYDSAVTWRWVPSSGTTFFDGYYGQDNVIFDEFRGQIPMGNLLTMLDGYPMTVQIKGSSVHWSPTKVILTSPIHPKEWYQSMGEDRVEQLLRRIDKITRFSSGPSSGA